MELAMAVGVFLGLGNFVVKYTHSTEKPRFKDLAAPGAAVAHLEGGLFFATAPAVVDALQERVVDSKAPLRVLVVDWTAVTNIDTKGALECKRLRNPGGSFKLIFCNVRPPVLSELIRSGVCVKPRLLPEEAAASMSRKPSIISAREIEMMAVASSLRRELPPAGAGVGELFSDVAEEEGVEELLGVEVVQTLEQAVALAERCVGLEQVVPKGSACKSASSSGTRSSPLA